MARRNREERFMAKIRPASGKQKKSTAKITDKLRALPCLLVVALGMLLLFYLFFMALKGS